ncbi:MAG TPA: glycosyltransferase, partial [Gammaproteobacteria bacterium]|nr:glycosyltransferase [Gammaproteobacteria bacterium]
LEAFARVRQDHPDCLLVLVPRHPERFDTVASLCTRNGLAVVRRTEDRPVDPGTPVFLGDTLGELSLFYAAADLAFIGGSLVPTGGHNMLEAAALGRAVVTGPHLFNFQEVSEHMLTARAMVRVENADELGETVTRLLSDSVERARMGEAGRALVAGNRGALERLVELTEGALARSTTGQ